MMVELLTAGLTGGAFSFEARERDPDDSNGTPTCNSELLIAIDPAQVG
jgi:LDH2 family malate/lactate/ureidoglycolate dehydrogenase